MFFSARLGVLCGESLWWLTLKFKNCVSPLPASPRWGEELLPPQEGEGWGGGRCHMLLR
jgi:hypothetical protein